MDPVLGLLGQGRITGGTGSPLLAVGVALLGVEDFFVMQRRSLDVVNDRLEKCVLVPSLASWLSRTHVSSLPMTGRFCAITIFTFAFFKRSAVITRPMFLMMPSVKGSAAVLFARISPVGSA